MASKFLDKAGLTYLWGKITALVGTKVSKSGDTMTGALTSTDYVSQYGYEFKPGSTVIGGIYQDDYNNNNQVYINEFTSTGKKECYVLPIPNTTETAVYYDLLTTKNAVTVGQGGTGATTAAGARTNLGAVNIAGDTMTGNLGVPKVTLISQSVDFSESPSSEINDDVIFVTDKNGNSAGVLRLNQSTSNVEGFQFGVRRTISSNTIFNCVTLSVAADGVRSVSVSDPAAWRTALGLGTMATESSSGYLALSGGTMTGGITLANTDSAILSLGNSAAWFMNKYGNITHNRSNANDYVGIIGYNVTGDIRFYYDSGNISTNGTITTSNGNLYLNKSDYPYLHLSNASGSEVAGLWANVSSKRVYIRVRPSAGSSYATDMVFPAATSNANANKYVYTSDNFSLSGTTLTITPPS